MSTTLPDWLKAGSSIGAAATALILTLAITPVVRKFAISAGLVGRPAQDRWGRRAVARLGGVAMYIAAVASILIWLPKEPLARTFVCGATLVFAVGLVDDVRRMKPYTKLLLQLAVGSVMAWGGIRIEIVPWSWLSVPLTIFWFVFVMNAFNLLDNMDGLAAGVGGIAALFCVLHIGPSGQPAVPAIGLTLTGICLGFLYYNFPPAKIFMGDSGSHLLGFGLGALALMGSWVHSTQLLSVLLVPMLVLAVPIFDMCFVTIQRLSHGRHPFQGGTDHVSHRLAILGLSPKQTVFALYLLSASFGMLSLLSVRIGLLTAFTLWLAALATLLLIAEYLARVRVYSVERQPINRPVSPTDQPITRIETMLFHKRRIFEVVIDFIVICGSYVGAHLLRFEGDLVDSQQRLLAQSLPLVIVLQMGSLAAVRLYQGVWRYISIPDMLTIFKGVTAGAVLSALSALFFWRFEGFSRAVFIIDWLLLFFGVCASRVGERLFNEWLATSVHGMPAVIIGAGDMGEMALRQIKHGTGPKRQIVGFLDDDISKQGSWIHGIRVLGTRSLLPYLISEKQVKEVFVAMEAPPEGLLDYVRRHCDSSGIRWQVTQTPVLFTAHEVAI